MVSTGDKGELEPKVQRVLRDLPAAAGAAPGLGRTSAPGGEHRGEAARPADQPHPGAEQAGRSAYRAQPPRRLRQASALRLQQGQYAALRLMRLSGMEKEFFIDF